MMPSARSPCRKAKLPITLTAVRALPRFKLRLKSIMDQTPSHKRGPGTIEDPAGNEAGPWILLAHSRWMTGEWPQLMRLESCGIIKKIRVSDSD